MRILLLMLLFACSLNSIAQKKLFIRVFDQQGKKVTSGRISTWTDSSLTIQVNAHKRGEFSLAQIGTIKTKRSIGHNVAIGAAIGAGVFGIAGAASGETEPAGEWDFFRITPAEGAAVGILLGMPFGAAIGGLTGLLKHSDLYSINGDQAKWIAFVSTLKQEKE